MSAVQMTRGEGAARHGMTAARILRSGCYRYPLAFTGCLGNFGTMAPFVAGGALGALLLLWAHGSFRPWRGNRRLLSN